MALRGTINMLALVERATALIERSKKVTDSPVVTVKDTLPVLKEMTEIVRLIDPNVLASKHAIVIHFDSEEDRMDFIRITQKANAITIIEFRIVMYLTMFFSATILFLLLLDRLVK